MYEMKESEKIILPDHLYKVLRPIIFICKAFCLFPFPIKRYGTELWIVWSRWRIFNTVCIIGVIVIYSFYGISINYQLEGIYKIRLGTFSSLCISVMEVIMLVSTFLLCCFSSVVNFKHLRKYFSSLVKVDVILKFQPSSIESKKCLLLILISAISTLIVISADLYIWSSIVAQHSNILFYILRQVPFYFYYTFMVVTAITYYTLVRCICVRLKFLNYNLRHDYGRWRLLNRRRVSEITILKVETLFFRHNSANETRLDSTQNVKINYSTGYEFLAESNRALNNYYGLILLVILLGNFVDLLITPYDLYIEVLHQKHSFIFLQSLWMIAHIARLVLIVEPCTASKREVKKMSRQICKLLNLKLDVEFREQLMIVLSQLDHCPIKFETCDMVSIDRYLLTKIAGGVTTYLVILFQFGK